MVERRRRVAAVFGTLLVIAASFVASQMHSPTQAQNEQPTSNVQGVQTSVALDALKTLPIKGRAPKTGYSRSQFGAGRQDMGNCNMRNVILGRDLRNVVTVSDADCNVVTGVLHDPYTEKDISFVRGASTSDDVQIDHVVALSDAWQKGAQQLSSEQRIFLANDPLNLLAVEGQANNKKGDSDAASWLPPNKSYRCQYIARQIAVKQKYILWVTQAEHDAMNKVLSGCPDQVLPVVKNP